MPYYSASNFAYFFADNLYWVLLIPIFALSIYAQIQVSSSFRKYSRQINRRRLTGAQAAQAMLRSSGVTGVGIFPVGGRLSDHYDPRQEAIFLSPEVYGAETVAAVGVACHEAGHAVQYAVGYGPVKFRMALIPAANLGSRFSFILLAAGLLLDSQSLFVVGCVLFAITTCFQLVTLPVELDASRRAMEAIGGQGLLDEAELPGARRVLRAAALTYVAALLTSFLQLLRYAAIFAARGGGNSRRGGGR
jgi:Zn-dependent membrane protease YugP